MVAATLYNSKCPVILVNQETLDQIRDGSELTISNDGQLT